MTKITWISYADGEAKEENGIGGTGGFFDDGMRFNDYLERFTDEGQELVKQLRDSIVKEQVWIGGDGHQNSTDGVPMWPDGRVASYSYRAWGDLMAAVWSTEHDNDYNYMSFYMDCGVPDFPTVKSNKSTFNLGKLEGLGEVKFNDQVPVTINFDHDKVIGMATLSKYEDGNIRASIDFGIPGGDETVEMVIGGAVVEREGVELKRFTLTSVAIVPKL